MDLENELRATSDRMLAMLDDVRALEQKKRDVPLGSPEFVALAVDVEQLTRLIFRWAGLQLQSAENSARAVAAGQTPPAPLTTIDPRPLPRILAAWREAQLRFELAPPGSAEAATASDDVERLREEFRAAQESRPQNS